MTLILSQKETKLTKKEVSLLSGMTPKPQNDELYAAWLKKGNKPLILPMGETATHSLRTKSHMRGGKHSRFNIGGNKWKGRKSA